MKKYDLMHSINGRGTFLTTQACLPFLLESKKQGKVPHILNNSLVFNNHLLYHKAITYSLYVPGIHFAPTFILLLTLNFKAT